MRMAVKEVVDAFERGHLLFIEDVPVREEDAARAVGDERVVGHDREAQQHLVDFRIAVAAHGNDVPRVAVEQRGDARRVQALRHAVARSVVEQVAEQAEEVASVLFKKLHYAFGGGQRTVYVGGNEQFHTGKWR